MQTVFIAENKKVSIF